MAFKQGFMLIALIAGCFATPILDDKQDLSIFFDYSSDDGNRVVGGTVAPEGSAPHMVALTWGLLIRSFSCGGSLVTKKSVLTAYHCVNGMYSEGSLISSYRGTVGTNRWNLGGITFSFSGNISHPDYDEDNIKNDIAILYINDDLTFNDLISPIPLSFGHVDGGVLVRVTGWGRIQFQGPISATLLELYKHTMGGEECIENVRRVSQEANIAAPHVDPLLELCTFHSVGHGVCNGDSGSALVRTDINQQVGVVSWGIPCSRGGADMYVRVSAYRDFLIENIV